MQLRGQSFWQQIQLSLKKCVVSESIQLLGGGVRHQTVLYVLGKSNLQGRELVYFDFDTCMWTNVSLHICPQLNRPAQYKAVIVWAVCKR